MKHLFIINPKAGGKNHDHEKTFAIIDHIMEETGENYEIYVTKAPGDATTKIVREAETGEHLRVYACGGDGTLNECVNGAVLRDNVAVTQFPCGTGNDFIRIFGDDAAKFKDIRALTKGKTYKIDAIKCGDRYGLNICSVGIDARIGADVHKYSKLPVIGGSTGYVASLCVNVFKGINTLFEVDIGDGLKVGRHALICACNGRFYGGGFNPVPDAILDDGLLDVLIVGEVALTQLPSLLGKYAKGKYRELTDYLEHHKIKEISISSPELFVVNIDGEAMYTGNVTFTAVHNAINLILPDGIKVDAFVNVNESILK